MKDKLLKLLDNAYAPYSKFHVACFVEMKDGRMVPGVNVENASYGVTLCAERNAITTAIALGYKKGDFPIAEEISETELSLPMYYGMQEKEIDYVVETINSFTYNK